MLTITTSLENIGISKVHIDLIVKNINKYINNEVSVYEFNGKLNVKGFKNDTVELFFYKIIGASSTKMRSIQVDNTLLENLLNVLNNILDIDEELNKFVYTILSKIEISCSNYGTNVYYKSVGSRKHSNREVEWTDAAYNKAFNNELTNGIKDINNALIKWISTETNLNIESVGNISSNVKNTIINLNKGLADLVFSTEKISSNRIITINKESVLSRVYKIQNETINNFINNSNSSNKELIIPRISRIKDNISILIS